MQSFVRHLNKHRKVVHHDPIYIERAVGTSIAEVALQYNDSFSEVVFSFANNIHTLDGGAHLTGFRSALTRTLNDYARKANILKEADANLSGDDVREGLVAVVSVRLTNPQFEGQTKGKLNNADIKNVVEQATSEGLMQYLEENPADGRKIIEKALTAARARDAARKARDVVRKNAGESSTLPGTLHRRGCIRRWHSQAGPRPPHPGRPAVAWQDPQRGKSPPRQDAGQRRDPGADRCPERIRPGSHRHALRGRSESGPRRAVGAISRLIQAPRRPRGSPSTETSSEG